MVFPFRIELKHKRFLRAPPLPIGLGEQLSLILLLGLFSFIAEKYYLFSRKQKTLLHSPFCGVMSSPCPLNVVPAEPRGGCKSNAVRILYHSKEPQERVKVSYTNQILKKVLIRLPPPRERLILAGINRSYLKLILN